MSGEGAQALRLTADGQAIERRRRPREASDARIRARVMEFMAVGAIAASLATGAWLMTEQALERPMALIASALG